VAAGVGGGRADDGVAFAKETTALGSPEPVRVGSLVMRSLALAPVSLLRLSLTAGAVVSRVKAEGGAGAVAGSVGVGDRDGVAAVERRRAVAGGGRAAIDTVKLRVTSPAAALKLSAASLVIWSELLAPVSWSAPGSGWRSSYPA